MKIRILYTATILLWAALAHSQTITVFSHEIGHSVFGLRHPNDKSDDGITVDDKFCFSILHQIMKEFTCESTIGKKYISQFLKSN